MGIVVPYKYLRELKSVRFWQHCGPEILCMVIQGVMAKDCFSKDDYKRVSSLWGRTTDSIETEARIVSVCEWHQGMVVIK